MNDRTKIVEVSGQRWQLARMTPVDGSYIWQRLMAANYKAQLAMVQSGQASQADPEAEKAAEEAMNKATPEDKMRSACGIAFMYLTYEDTAFIQRKAMALTSRLELMDGDTEARPIQVQTTDGRWAVKELEDSPFLLTKLTMEVLVYNLASFLAESGPSTRTA